LTRNGPKVLEFNVRFGDPETQVILPLVEEDLVPVLISSAKGQSLPSKLSLKNEYAIVVVLASKGYPNSYPTGEEITSPSEHPSSSLLIHAGTSAAPDGKILSSGGRVLGVVGTGKSLEDARNSAYALCENVQFTSKYFRKDIGYKEFSRS